MGGFLGLNWIIGRTMRHSIRAIALAIPVLFPSLVGAQDVPLAWDFSEVWRAGGLDAPEWAQFTRPGEVAFDGSGNLYVVDGAALHIVKVGPDGSLVTTIGRAGEGPGEFGLIFGMIVWPNGSFVVNDARRNGLQLFSADGTFDRMVRWHPAISRPGLSFGSARTMSPRTMRPGPRPGILYAQGTDAGFGRMLGAAAELAGSEPEENGADERMIEALDLSGDVVSGQTLLEAWRPPRPEGTNAEIDLGDLASMLGTIAAKPVFEPELVWDVLPGGAIAYADSSTYTIRIVRGGAVLNTLTRLIAPQPVTGAIQSRAREGMLRVADGERAVEGSEIPGIDMTAAQRELGAAMRASIENMTFYPEVPIIARIRATPDGFVWVRRQDPVNEDNDGLIDVFDPEGSYVGTFPRVGLRMPHAFGPSGLVAYWETDDMDIPSIVVYRLPANLRR